MIDSPTGYLARTYEQGIWPVCRASLPRQPLSKYSPHIPSSPDTIRQKSNWFPGFHDLHCLYVYLPLIYIYIYIASNKYQCALKILKQHKVYQKSQKNHLSQICSLNRPSTPVKNKRNIPRQLRTNKEGPRRISGRICVVTTSQQRNGPIPTIQPICLALYKPYSI